MASYRGCWEMVVCKYWIFAAFHVKYYTEVQFTNWIFWNWLSKDTEVIMDQLDVDMSVKFVSNWYSKNLVGVILNCSETHTTLKEWVKGLHCKPQQGQYHLGSEADLEAFSKPISSKHTQPCEEGIQRRKVITLDCEALQLEKCPYHKPERVLPCY